MKRVILILILLLTATLCSPARADNDAEVLAIRAGKIWPVVGDVIINGVIIVKNGRIEAVGKDIAVPEKATVLDMPKCSVMPGIIDAHSHIGLWTDAAAEMDETVFAATADMHILSAFDPQSKDIEKAVRAGVTCALIAPGNKNPIAGQAAVVKFVTGPVKQRIVKADAGLKLSVTNDALQNDRRPTSRPGLIDFIKEHLDKARQYSPQQFDPQAKALKRLTDRKQFAFIAADTGDEIAAALAIAKQYNLKARLVGARFGDEWAEQIAAQKIPVIYPPMLKVSKDRDLARPAKLAAAGVKIAFASNAPQSNPADIRTSAVIAAKYGMDRNAALRSITMNAAEILGVANRLGSIRKGKDADLVILSGDPLELTSAVVVVIINGDIVYQREEK